MDRRTIVSTAVVALIVVGGAIGATYAISSGSEVAAVEVQQRDVDEFIVASGRLQTQRTSHLGTEVSGVIDDIAVRSGDHVKRGEVLATLHPSDAHRIVEQRRAALLTQERELARLRSGPTDAELASARAGVAGASASLDEARTARDRERNLLKNGVGTAAKASSAKTRFEVAKADLEHARNQLRVLQEGAKPAEVEVGRSRVREARVALSDAESQLDKYEIVAPFDGLVTSTEGSPGEAVAPGAPLVTVARMRDAEIYVEVDEDYLDRIRPKQQAKIVFRSHPGRSWHADVAQIGPETDIGRGTVGVHLKPRELPGSAFPGLSADVSIEVAHHPNASAVPARAIVKPHGAEPYVLVVADSTAQRRNVTLVGEGSVWVAVQGVDPGTTLVLDAAKINSGTHVDPKLVDPATIGDAYTGGPSS